MKILKVFLICAISLISIMNHILYAQEKSSVCFTFDDGSPKNILDYSYIKWNQMILDHLKDSDLKAIFFVGGKNMDNPKGKIILNSWDSLGHIIANHTYNHLNYNSEEVSFGKYKDDILLCDSFISSYKNYQRYFRAPFLKYGESKEERDSLNAFIKRINYKNGYVTIDASDWFFNMKLIKFLDENPGASIDKYKKAYIDHLL